MCYGEISILIGKMYVFFLDVVGYEMIYGVMEYIVGLEYLG